MQLIRREELEKLPLPGRVIQKAVGKDGFSLSGRMTLGFAYHSGATGHEPHHHAEELVYVLDAKDATVRYGPTKDQLGPALPLHAGMIMHFPALEWHVFEIHGDGHADTLFFYGQVDNIRPEETPQNN